jgi:hypothetical protein
MRSLWLLAACACATGNWQSPIAEHPATREELASVKVTVDGPPELTEALRRLGFPVVEHPPYHQDLMLRYADGVATLRSDGFFVDEVRGDPQSVAEQLARSARVAEFIRNSGMPDQRANPGM